MSTSQLQQHQSASLGGLFTRVYQRPERLLPESKKFRVRLNRYFDENFSHLAGDIANFMASEGGLDFSFAHGVPFEPLWMYEPIGDVLNAVTLNWMYLKERSRKGGSFRGSYDNAQQADRWLAFVQRCFTEEHLGYRLDEKCGVHFFVDEAFESSRVSVISGLSRPRHAAVRDAFEKAHAYLDASPPDTKAAVRAAFESLESLSRLMVPEAQSLNRGMIDKKLKPLLLGMAPSPVDQQMLEKLMDSLGWFVDSIHLYRHGQGVEQPIKPPLDVAVYVLSSIGAALRWLAPMDTAGNAE